MKGKIMKGEEDEKCMGGREKKKETWEVGKNMGDLVAPIPGVIATGRSSSVNRP